VRNGTIDELLERARQDFRLSRCLKKAKPTVGFSTINADLNCEASPK
jgi:hypothetical protein